MDFRVRLNGFRFLAHVPPDAAVDEEGVAVEAVGLDALVPGKGTKQVPCDWLLVKAKGPAEAEKAFKSAHGIKKALAPFVVEPGKK